MKIHLISDIHLELLDYTPNWEAPEGTDVIVLAGDIHTGISGVEWAAEQFPHIPVVYVAGNHEYYGKTLESLNHNLKAAAANTNNVVFLDGDETEINGVRFVGCTLWTDFALYGKVDEASMQAKQLINDFNHINMRLINGNLWRFEPHHWIELNKKHANFLMQKLLDEKDEKKKTVVVTHHLPSESSVAERFKNNFMNPAFASNYNVIIEDSEVDLWLHGHTHDSCDYVMGKTRVVCNPGGYRFDNESFVDNLLLEI